VIADRRAGHNGHSSSWKPWGDALRLPVSPDWFTNLRERVLTGYRGPIPLVKTSSKPRILYLERQGSGRELTPEAHEALMASLLELDEEGLADVTIEAFSGKIPFEDQVAKISTVDVSCCDSNELSRSQQLTVPRSSYPFTGTA
jgi:protein O-GlcNAc transferase